MLVDTFVLQHAVLPHLKGKGKGNGKGKVKGKLSKEDTAKADSTVIGLDKHGKGKGKVKGKLSKEDTARQIAPSLTRHVHAKAKARVKHKRVLLKFALRCRMQRESIRKAEENAFHSAFLAFEDQDRAIKAAQDHEEKEFQRLYDELSTAQHEFDTEQQQRKAAGKASKSSRAQHQLKFTRAEVAHMNRDTLRRILN